MILATAVILIVVTSIAVLGVTTFIIQRLSQAETKRISAKAVYLAQAGIHHAIYSYRSRDIAANGYIGLGRTDLDANDHFLLSATPANLLMVDTTQAALTNDSRRLSGLLIQNATNSNTITIDRMIVDWPPNGNRLKEIWINNGRLFLNTQGLAPPADANINNFTLDTIPTKYPLNYFIFSGSMAGVSQIDVQFVMSDGSVQTQQLYPASNSFRFSVQATGQTKGSGLSRTIRAQYNANTGTIEDFRATP